MEVLLGFGAGLAISVLTAPVGVSGAVFLLPFQTSVLGVPSPAVTPTNLLFNVVAAPGALLRYRRDGSLNTPLTRLLITGTVPGVVLGALVRVLAVPGPGLFRVLTAMLLAPVGAWLITATLRPPRRLPHAPMTARPTLVLALIVGVAGGVYGIGGGSLLGPILVARGTPVATVAPAALASTFITSLVGAGAYALLALTTRGDTAPHWILGLACGGGGLLGGYLSARLRPRLPETALRLTLGGLAITIAAAYLAQALTT